MLFVLFIKRLAIAHGWYIAFIKISQRNCIFALRSRMMKRIWSLFAVLALLCALTIPALAAAGGTADAEPAAQTVSEEELARSKENTTKVRKIWAVAALIGVACFGGALGMAHSVAKAANNMAEQPEAAGQIRTSMMMGLVFIETVIIYALIVAILIIFVL